MDSVTKGLMGQSPRQNFWAKTAPVLENSCRVRSLLKPNVTDKPFCQTFFERSISDKQWQISTADAVRLGCRRHCHIDAAAVQTSIILYTVNVLSRDSVAAGRPFKGIFTTAQSPPPFPPLPFLSFNLPVPHPFSPPPFPFPTLQGWARDLSGLDRDENRDAQVRDRDETEMLGILSETRPRRDVEGPRRDRDVSARRDVAETYGENH